jgi:hypothetical protein
MTVSPEDFVRAWQSSSSIAEVVKKLGMSKSSVASRASYYRQNGVRLKRLNTGRSLDTDALNAIVDAGESPPAAPRKKKGGSE